MIKTRRGLDLPINGSPAQVIDSTTAPRTVALVGYDYNGLKPTMEVGVGDRVKVGQLLFTDKKNAGVRFTSPGAGEVVEINRGDKRVFQSLVVRVDGDEAETFKTFDAAGLAALSSADARSQLIESGQWTAFRTRPFSRIPSPDAEARSIFVTAIDTRPLAGDPGVVLAEEGEAWEAGLTVIGKLTEGAVHVCTAPALSPALPGGNFQHHQFDGPHPAGLAGTHIHFVEPVHTGAGVWTIGYQDVVAIGHLFLDGQVYLPRVVALGGPSVKSPRLLRTRIGASLSDLVADELVDGNHRTVSGSVLDGRNAAAPLDYLGRYHDQVSVLEEGTHREFMGFVMPGAKKFSLTRLFTAGFLGGTFDLTTSTGGSDRAMVPLGTYEEVMPLDVLPTQLLRALLVQDVEESMALGCLELDEDDLALCTFACPGKYEYGPYLRQMLTTIEAEG